MTGQKDITAEVLGIKKIPKSLSRICANFPKNTIQVQSRRVRNSGTPQAPCYLSGECNGICSWFEHRDFRKYNNKFGPAVSGAYAGALLQEPTKENMTYLTKNLERAHYHDNPDPLAKSRSEALRVA
jgi:hypothetical protein